MNGQLETAGWDTAGTFGDGNPLRQPFAVASRWVSGEKTFNLARWLAVEPMQSMHAEHVKVRWRFAHARNFACRALRSGHSIDALLAAYSAGLQRSHDDAGMAGETARDNEPREPSAAVNYAWRELFKDTRSRDERWAAIFAGERAPRRPRARPPAPESAVPAAGQVEEISHSGKKSSTRDRAKFAVLKAKLEGKTSTAGPELTAGELAAHLERRGMTLAHFTAMPWTSKNRLVQDAINQRLRCQ